MPTRREKQKPRRARRTKSGGSGAASKSSSSRQWQRPARPSRRSARGDSEPREGAVSIELSKAQIDQVVRSAGQSGTLSVLLSAVRDPDWPLSLDSEGWGYPTQMDDRRLSRSLLSGLLVLSCFPPDGGYLGIAELARMLNMNTSTTHRYVTTLLAVGLLERDPGTRKYRLIAE
ncbi:MAG TPA: helix-turn-helix domain-containing protein [Solirubrobacteraceae bacterium]